MKHHHHHARKPHIKTKPKVRFIEDLRNKHKGEEIWIVGPGPTIDDYPDNFFDNKITIALKGSMVVFPNSTYFMHFIFSSCAFSRSKRVYDWLQDGRMHFLKQFIVPTHITEIPHKFQNLPDWRDPIRMLRKKATIEQMNKRCFYETVEKLVATARSIMRKQPCNFPCSLGNPSGSYPRS